MIDLKHKSIAELERIVLSFLLYRTAEDLAVFLDQLDPGLWLDPKGKKMLEMMRDFVATEQGGRASDWLIYQFRPASYLTELMMELVPYDVGVSAIRQTTYLQEERKFKQSLKKLSNKPLTEIKPALYELVKQPVLAYKPKSMSETAKQRVRERKLEARAPSTGYLELDRYIKGFIPGHIYVLSGDTNAGKSTMCLNFVHRLSVQGKTSLYFALEPENTIVDYLVSIKMKKPFSQIVEDDIISYDDPNISVFGKEQIREVEDLVRAVHSLPRYDLIVIDHIGYFTGNTNNTVARQSDVMKHLAGLAKERQCAVMVIQHQNKAKADKKSPENNITGSAAFKQDATDVLILRRDQDEDEFGALKSLNTGAILIRKSKSDLPQGVVPIEFISGTALIIDGRDQVEAF